MSEQWNLDKKKGKSLGDSTYPLHKHLLDVAVTAELFSERFGLSKVNEVSYLAFLGGAIHDLGKVSEKFQQKLVGNNYSANHVDINVFFKKFLLDEYSELLPPYGELFLEAALGHHGTPLPLIKARNFPRKKEKYLSASDFKWVRNYVDNYLKNNFNPEVGESWIDFSRELNGLLTSADWLASSNSFLRKSSTLKASSINSYREAIRDLVRELIPPRGSVDSISSFDDIFEFEPRPIQETADNLELYKGGLYIIESLTGSGKTEAGLTLAAKLMNNFNLNLYFALPTRATTNSMAKRFIEDEIGEALYGEPVDLAVAHSKSKSFHSDLPGRRTSFFSESIKTALLEDFSLGTIDQAALSVLPVSHNSLRQLGLSRAVLIVDEVHDYDPYLNNLLKQLISLRSENNLPTILFSATLSNQRRREFLQAHSENTQVKNNDYFPRVTVSSENSAKTTKVSGYQEKTVKIKWIHSVDEALSILGDNSRGGWIRNTVQDAREVFSLSSFETFLLHSRFTVGDRKKMESKLLNLFGPEGQRSEAKPVVGTQVLEQSLDIDFDVMITDLAPMDRLIQRCGRLHRHERGRSESPTLYVLAPEFEPEPVESWYQSFFPRGAFVYADHSRVWKTMLALRRNENQIKMPDDNRHLIESVYNIETPEGLKEIENEVIGERIAASDTAQFNSLNLDEAYGEYNSRSDYKKTTTVTRLGSGVTELQLMISETEYLNESAKLSTLSVSHRVTGGEVTEADSMADNGTPQVIMEKSGDKYRGSFTSEAGVRELIYSHKTGLKIS